MFGQKGSSRFGETGQILLIVILVVIVTSTIGLSLISRSVTSLRSSSEDVESQKALAAAEAGIERSIQGNISIGNTSFPGNNASYSTEVFPIQGASFLVSGGNIILQDEGADVWLSDYSADPSLIYNNPWSGNLTVYWGESTNACNNSALEIVIVLGPKTNPTAKRYAYDPCSARRSDNNFSAPSGSGSVGGKSFYSSAVISGISQALIARIIPIYRNATAAVAGSAALPSQGSVNTSTGISGSTTRKITTFAGYMQVYLPYLSYGLFVPESF